MVSSFPTKLVINGFEIQFPCKPYPSQICMMERILKGLERKQNCLLESPTGSGKSLALLCSCLAWRQVEKEKVRIAALDAELGLGTSSFLGNNFPAAAENKEDKIVSKPEVTTIEVCDDDDDDNNDDDDDDFKPTTKKFKKPSNTTSTFAAGKQASTSPVASTPVSESPTAATQTPVPCWSALRQPPPRRVPKIFFGTRTHKQIAQIISELNKTVYKDVQMTVLSSREYTCVNPRVSKSKNKNEDCKKLLDGEEGNHCTYFQNQKRFGLNKSRKGLSSPWDIEDLVKHGKAKMVCSYFLARNLKDYAEIVFCPYNYLIDPLIRKSLDISLKGEIIILDEAHNIEESAREAVSYSVTQDELQDAIKDLEFRASHGMVPDVLRELADLLSKLSSWIYQEKDHVNDYSSFSSSGKVWTGLEISAILNHLGWGNDNFSSIKTLLNKAVTPEEDQPKERSPIGSIAERVFSGLIMSLGYLYGNNMCHMDDYRVCLTKEMSSKTDSEWISRRKSNNRKQWTYKLNFWCLNPAVAFSDFSDVVHSIVVSSGTLSPMSSFQSELGISFPIQLEANHVIKKSQVWVGTISHGLNGTSLNACYRNSETFEFQDEIGNLILKVCQKVPYGILCFLPSYSMLDKLVNRWKMTGLHDKITSHKLIVSEPRGSDKENFTSKIQEFYDCIIDNEDPEINRGALFLAVCRGKVSEGLNFSDNNARAVITIGIPFPNVKDIQVTLKRQYNDKHWKSRGLLSGNDWYEIQAFRALNQALGRCIRHKNDWGALILVDNRFAQKRYTTGLSKWVRQLVSNFRSANEALESLASFTTLRLDGSQMDRSLNSSLNTTFSETISLKECQKMQPLAKDIDIYSLTSTSSATIEQQSLLPLSSISSNRQQPVQNNSINSSSTISLNKLVQQNSVSHLKELDQMTNITIQSTIGKQVEKLPVLTQNKVQFLVPIKTTSLISLPKPKQTEFQEIQQTKNQVTQLLPLKEENIEVENMFPRGGSNLNNFSFKVNNSVNIQVKQIGMNCNPGAYSNMSTSDFISNRIVVSDQISGSLNVENLEISKNIDLKHESFNLEKNVRKTTRQAHQLSENLDICEETDSTEDIESIEEERCHSPSLFDSEPSTTDTQFEEINDFDIALEDFSEILEDQTKLKVIKTKYPVDHCETPYKNKNNKYKAICSREVDSNADENIHSQYCDNLQTDTKAKSGNLLMKSKISFDELNVCKKRKRTFSGNALQTYQKCEYETLPKQRSSGHLRYAPRKLSDSLLEDLDREELRKKHLVSCRPGVQCSSCGYAILQSLEGISFSKKPLIAVLKAIQTLPFTIKCQCHCSDELNLESQKIYLVTNLGDSLQVKASSDWLNAHWSEDDQCCCQLVVCPICNETIGMKVLATCSSEFFQNQVWFMNRAVWLCSKLLKDRMEDSSPSRN